MLIHGLQKLTLLDFPTKVAATVFFGGCNFRCPFCHNASLVTHIDNSGTQTDEQVLSFLKKRQGLLDGVCVTGGEPLLQPELPAFLRRIKEMGFAVKLDTNGSNPAALKALVGEGLVDYVAMDIKNAPTRYAETVGIPNFDVAPIAESVAFLLSDAVDYEFRTTVVKEFHRVEDIEAAAQFIRGAKRYFLQNFEDSGDLIQTGLSAVAPETLEAMQKAATPYIQYIGVRGI